MDCQTNQHLNLLQLPVEIIHIIISYLSYDEIAKIRGVNHQFNAICSQRLNDGYGRANMVVKKSADILKGQLPRRMSQKKYHPLAWHSDVLKAIEHRMSLLTMTYIKHMEKGLCCFIPGKVLDELFSLLRKVNFTMTPDGAAARATLPKGNIFLEELRDLSVMAVDHFEEEIIPLLDRVGPNQSIQYPKLKTDNRSCILETVRAPRNQIVESTSKHYFRMSGFKKSLRLPRRPHNLQQKCISGRECRKLQKGIKKMTKQLINFNDYASRQKKRTNMLAHALNLQRDSFNQTNMAMFYEIKHLRKNLVATKKELQQLKALVSSSGGEASGSNSSNNLTTEREVTPASQEM